MRIIDAIRAGLVTQDLKPESGLTLSLGRWSRRKFTKGQYV
jgi:hypothetical protein